MEINYFDVIVAAILLFAVIKGAVNGFVLELAQTVALVIGVLGAWMIGGWAGDYLGHWVQWPYMGIISFLLVFMIVTVLVYLLGNTITKLLKMSGINFFNRVLGGAFSLFKFAFVISVILLILNYFGKGGTVFPEAVTQNSFFYPYLVNLASNVIPFFKLATPDGIINL